MSRSSGERSGALAQKRADDAQRMRDFDQAPPAAVDANPLAMLQQTAGNGAVTQLLASRAAAARAERSTSGDLLESEARSVADSVLHEARPHRQPAAAAGDDAARSAHAPIAAHDAPATVHDVLRTPGRPLDTETRVDMQSRFGRDFSDVRVHDGADAEQSTHDVNARAFTVGSHIVFGPSRFAPGTQEGRRLLAHELTHVVQQSGSREPTPTIGAIGASGTAAVAASAIPSVSGTSVGVVQREPKDKSEMMKRLADVRAELSAGKGVRTPEATQKLESEKLQLETELGIAAPLKPPGSAPSIDWGGGNLRGIGAEEEVLGASYPGATRLPRGFPGVDFVEGGTRTPLTGGIKTKGVTTPYTADSEVVEGATAIQLKTLKNSDDSYQKPNGIVKTLTTGLEKLANVKPGVGKSEKVGNEWRRIEIGSISKKILHVELETPPTPDQQAQLDRITAAGKSFGAFGPGEEIEVVVNFPKISAPPPSAAGPPPSAAGAPPAAPNVPAAPIAGVKPTPPASATPHVDEVPEGAPIAPKVAVPSTVPQEEGAAPTKPPAAAPKVDPTKAAAGAKPPGAFAGVGSALKSAGVALALDYLNGLLKDWIAEEEIEQQSAAELVRLGPAIDAMIATNPKQIHAVFHVDIWTSSHDVIGESVTEKTGFPMVTVHAELSDHHVPTIAPVPKTEVNGMTSLTTSHATYSVLLIDVEKELEKARVQREEQKLNERVREFSEQAKARGQLPPPASPAPQRSGAPNNALLPAPPTPQPSLLPGAPPPSLDQEAYADYARQFGASLLAQGTHLRNSSAPDADRATFRSQVLIWRAQMKKLIRDFGNFKAKDSLMTTLGQFDERMQSLASELGLKDWKED